ncbi:MAG: hypothetical protein ACTSR2_10145 [Candidatus Hodarchaeales archaeon]
MKKLRLMFYGGMIVALVLQFYAINGSHSSNILFITSYWNTSSINTGTGLDDWSEAGNVAFLISGIQGTFYVKNDYQDLYLGILILGEPNSSISWRVNFDVDTDGYWAEDAKELTIIEDGDGFKLEIDDQNYLQGDPTPYSDPQSDDFSARMRIFTYFGKNYTILELTIPLQSNDLLNDMQITSPEESIVGVSLDVFYNELGTNGTWKGSPYPNYAQSSNYAHIIFAGSQDRQIPIFEEEPPGTTETWPEDTQYPFTERAAASFGFEFWVTLVTIAIISTILYRERKR